MWRDGVQAAPKQMVGESDHSLVRRLHKATSQSARLRESLERAFNSGYCNSPPLLIVVSSLAAASER